MNRTFGRFYSSDEFPAGTSYNRLDTSFDSNLGPIDGEIQTHNGQEATASTAHHQVSPDPLLLRTIGEVRLNAEPRTNGVDDLAEK